MAEAFTNPLLPTSAALDGIEPKGGSLDGTSVCKETTQALLAAPEEREALLAVVGAAAGLIDVLKDDDAAEADDAIGIKELGGGIGRCAQARPRPPRTRG